MARQQTCFESPKSIVGAALIGLGIVIVLGRLDGPAAQLTHLLGAAARQAPELIPAFVLAGWQALQVYAFDHQRSFACPLQTLVSFWPLLRILAGAA
jgi:hypothetical protein